MILYYFSYCTELIQLKRQNNNKGNNCRNVMVNLNNPDKSYLDRVWLQLPIKYKRRKRLYKWVADVASLSKSPAKPKSEPVGHSGIAWITASLDWLACLISNWNWEDYSLCYWHLSILFLSFPFCCIKYSLYSLYLEINGKIKKYSSHLMI